MDNGRLDIQQVTAGKKRYLSLLLLADEQVLYNLKDRGIEYDLIPWSRRHGILGSHTQDTFGGMVIETSTSRVHDSTALPLSPRHCARLAPDTAEGRGVVRSVVSIHVVHVGNPFFHYLS